MRGYILGVWYMQNYMPRTWSCTIEDNGCHPIDFNWRRIKPPNIRSCEVILPCFQVVGVWLWLLRHRQLVKWTIGLFLFEHYITAMEASCKMQPAPVCSTFPGNQPVFQNKPPPLAAAATPTLHCNGSWSTRPQKKKDRAAQDHSMCQCFRTAQGPSGSLILLQS